MNSEGHTAELPRCSFKLCTWAKIDNRKSASDFCSVKSSKTHSDGLFSQVDGTNANRHLLHWVGSTPPLGTTKIELEPAAELLIHTNARKAIRANAAWRQLICHREMAETPVTTCSQWFPSNGQDLNDGFRSSQSAQGAATASVANRRPAMAQ